MDPLAIELAAARVKAMSLEQIEARLNDRFRLLTGGSRAALPRQQTLKALIDWSYDLLNDQEKTLLHRLSVFAGGWTLEAAENVCAGEGIEAFDVLDLLLSMVDKSLVIYEIRKEKTRYRLLETVRQYARDKLLGSVEEKTYRRQHRDYFLIVAEEAGKQLTCSKPVQWLDVFDAEHDNLRNALNFCLEESGEIAAGLRMTTTLYHFWERRGYLTEGRERLAAVLTRPDSQRHSKGPRERAQWSRDFSPAARRLCTSSLAI